MSRKEVRDAGRMCLVSDKPLRADARRNRDRVLAAADAVFAERGTTASTEEVAREAGVGIGTVFRHFPTKEALLEAVLLGRLDQLVGRARALADDAEPGEALLGFLRHVVAESATKIAFADAVAAAGVDLNRLAGAYGRDLVDALDVLLRRAQESGEIRADVEVPELHALVVGVSRAAELAGWDERITERSLAIVFDGLRPPASRTP
jgi:AcrR family transcriptional regulator